MSGDKSFVVHGAFAFCDQGSRPARIIVPASHGEYIHEQPQLNIHDFFLSEMFVPLGCARASTTRQYKLK
ncbi:hypothetical protein ACFQY3_11945 [Paenibacillus farraposensis]|uniref:hypothetical protein n=1 Tax=Paenibacillus farraposensis TaxID=2807095 RepID=UPI003609FC86